MKKTQDEISLSNKTIAGNIVIGTEETDGIRHIATTVKNSQIDHLKSSIQIF